MPQVRLEFGVRDIGVFNVRRLYERPYCHLVPGFDSSWPSADNQCMISPDSRPHPPSMCPAPQARGAERLTDIYTPATQLSKKGGEGLSDLRRVNETENKGMGGLGPVCEWLTDTHFLGANKLVPVNNKDGAADLVSPNQ